MESKKLKTEFGKKIKQNLKGDVYHGAAKFEFLLNYKLLIFLNCMFHDFN